jgi:CBS domain-containing protein
MKAADVMTREPMSVTPQTTIVEAARLMLQHRISGLPVTDAKGEVAGIVTEGDLLRRAETGTERHRSSWLTFLVGPGRLARDYASTHARKVGEVMTSEVAVVAPSHELAVVVELMEKHRIRRVPVVDKGKLVGIVSRADLVGALVQNLTQEAEAHAHEVVADETIHDRILETIDKEPWGPRCTVDVKVKGGIVDLHGTIMDDRERTAVIVAAESVAGVRAVKDHLVWIEPTSGFAIGADDPP